MDNFALDQFCRHLADRRRAPLTIARYTSVLSALGAALDRQFGVGAWTYDYITREHVVRFLREHAAASSSTQNVVLAALRGFFSFLVAGGMAARDPTTGIEFAPTKEREPVFLTRREYDRFLRAVRRVSEPSLVIRNEAIVVVLYNTGLRVGELAALTIEMLDFGSRAFRNVPLKGGATGSIEWNRETERVLDAWLAVRKTWSVPTSARTLFVSDRNGRPLSVRAIEQAFEKFSRASRLGKRVTPHVLRHSMATEVLRQGYDIRVIAGLLHHRSLNTSKKYAHLVDITRRRALASLEPRPSRRS